jgi:hypothetical protein
MLHIPGTILPGTISSPECRSVDLKAAENGHVRIARPDQPERHRAVEVHAPVALINDHQRP